MRRCSFCVEARPIVNRGDDASVDAQEFVDVRDRVGGLRSGQVILVEVGYQAAEDVLPRAAVDQRRMRVHGPSHLCGAAAGPAAARHFCRSMPLTRVLKMCGFQPFGAPRRLMRRNSVQSTVVICGQLASEQSKLGIGATSAATLCYSNASGVPERGQELFAVFPSVLLPLASVFKLEPRPS